MDLLYFGFRKRAYFVDLFVRVSNQVAIKMYLALGYIQYRQVLEYYSGDPDEDAYGKCN
jgi:N-terminal acetyltransferase B complex catalytic subunit